MCQDFATSAQLFSKQILTCAEHEPVGLPKTQHFHRFKTKESIRKIKPTYYLDIFLEKKCYFSDDRLIIAVQADI